MAGSAIALPLQQCQPAAQDGELAGNEDFALRKQQILRQRWLEATGRAATVTSPFEMMDDVSRQLAATLSQT